MKAKVEPTEMEQLQTEEDNLSRRERASGETVLAVKARAEAIDGELGAAAAKGDDALFAALADEAAALPAKLRAAEAAYNGIRAARAPIAARLGELRREALLATFDGRRTELLATGEANAVALAEALSVVGKLIADRAKLGAEFDGLRGQLAQYGTHAPPIPDFRRVVETANDAARHAGRVEAVAITVMVPV